jgi:hypothetical protein
MEPDPLELMQVPVGTKSEDVSEKQAYKIPPIKSRWSNGVFFKDFHKKTIEHYS